MAKKTSPKPLPLSILRQACDPEQFSFDVTEELDDLADFIGQNRALNAATLGIGIPGKGFNIFALGPIGQGKRTIVHALLKKEAKSRPTPEDICYIHNFKDPKAPKALLLPAGVGKELAQDIAVIIDILRTEIPSIFESKAYIDRMKEIQEDLRKKQEQGLTELENEALKKSITVIRTGQGFMLALLKNDQIVSDEDFQALPKEEKDEKDMEVIRKKLNDYLDQLPLWHKEMLDKVKASLAYFTMTNVGAIFSDIKKKYSACEKIQAYLDTIEQEILNNPKDFLKKSKEGLGLFASEYDQTSTKRYGINVLVDNHHTKGAPVIYEDNPVLANLVGRIDHVSQFGALVTDFSQIRPGALHKACGGYLILDARKLLTEPFAWDALKRCLRARMIRIENATQLMGYMGASSSLDPEPIPLDVKVILIGERRIYYLLCELDPDFLELFKIAADFNEDLPRNRENNLLFARFLKNLSKADFIKPLTKYAVAEVIDYASRLVDDSKKISTHVGKIMDLLREASYLSDLKNAATIDRDHVEEAVHNQVERASRLKERHHQFINRGVILIETAGQKVGQINGLSVVELGGYRFGYPVRITVRVGAGRAGVIDIEREVKLGGPIHSKGVMILSGFLSGRYLLNKPISVSLSLVLEQSYGGIEGDSATLAEAAAIISALANVPIKQNIAITGSMNQHGEAQAVGGVTDKIKGFFDIVKSRGFKEHAGVIIPFANIDNLMLPKEIISAIEEKKFSIYAVKTIDEALDILMDEPVGTPLARTKTFPKNSINGKVLKALARFSGKKL